MTTSVLGERPFTPKAKSVPKSAPPPSQPATEQAVVPGACTPFTAAVVDSAGIPLSLLRQRFLILTMLTYSLILVLTLAPVLYQSLLSDSDNNRTRIVTFDQGMANLGQALVPQPIGTF